MEIKAICSQINKKSKNYHIGKLQKIRKILLGLKRPNTNDIFSDKTIFDTYAFHSGGRTELQFNIGFEDGGFRCGIAFSFMPSPSFTNPKELKLQVLKLNSLIESNPVFFSQFKMWDWTNDERSDTHEVRQISEDYIKNKSFVFIGKLDDTCNTDDVLQTFDDLLEIYVEVINRKNIDVEEFLFSPNFKFKKRDYKLPQIRNISSTEKSINIKIRHSLLQKKLYDLLIKKYGEENVSYENPLGKNRIDMVVRNGGSIYFYEVKVALSAKACIRESLGQILEYAYYPDKNNAEKLFIVGEFPLDEYTNKYLLTLRSRFNISVSYLQIKV